MNEKITVLVADDNSDFTMTLSSYLEKEEQIQIVGIAKDGNEAYEKAIELKPDILLLDIIMPHLDGLGVLEKLGETNLEKSPLVIILSAVGQDKITQKAISLGAQYYIVKPFVKEVLLARVEMHLERSAKETGKSFADAAIEKNRGEIQKKLTPIEWKIALAVAQGMENREIAEQMNYSYGYVKNVIARIFSKLEIERRRELRKLLIG